MQYVLFLFGLILLLKAAEWFVDASIRIARLLRIPTVVIGATLVSIATTLPELIVAFIAGLRGHAAIAFGNAIGTPIVNLGLIFPLFFIAVHLQDSRKTLLPKLLLFLAVAFTLWVIAIFTGELGVAAGLLLILSAILYIVVMYRASRPIDREEHNLSSSFFLWVQLHMIGRVRWDEEELITVRAKTLAYLFGRFLFGLVALIVAGEVLVDQGVAAAASLHVPDFLIGFTVIAVGTSLPELATAISAIRNAHYGLSLSNLVSASMLTVSLALGVAVVLQPIPVRQSTIFFDFPMVFLVALSTIYLLRLRPKKAKRASYWVMAMSAAILLIRSAWLSAL